MLRRDEFIAAVTNFIIGVGGPRNQESNLHIEENANLFEAGLVDSLAIVELILHMEKLIDAEVPVEKYRVESFYTLEGIYRIAAESAAESGL